MAHPEELDALAAKYATLAALRRRRDERHAAGHQGFDADEVKVRRDTMRALAHAWPGALRELEVHDAETLTERARQVLAAREGASPAPWIELVLDLHGALREVLAIKLWLARARPARPFDDATVAACAAWYAARGPRRGAVTVTAASLTEVHQPVRGRVMPLVLGWVAAQHGVSPVDVEAAMFGARTR